MPIEEEEEEEYFSYFFKYFLGLNNDLPLYDSEPPSDITVVKYKNQVSVLIYLDTSYHFNLLFTSLPSDRTKVLVLPFISHRFFFSLNFVATNLIGSSIAVPFHFLMQLCFEQSESRRHYSCSKLLLWL